MAAREDARLKTGQEPQIPVFTVLKNSAILKNIFLINSSSSVDETHREDSSKNRQDLEQNFVVGRHPDCDIRLEHPSVSRFHLRIHSKPSAKRLSVTDLSSAHGTWISGRRIQPKIRVDVNEGDALRIGASSRVYRLHWVPLQKAYSSKPFIPRLDLPSLDEEKEEEMRLDENALELENGVKTADSVAVASKDANSLLPKREGDERPLVSGCECFVDSAFEAIRALVCNQFETNVVQDENAIACSKEDGKALESPCSEGSMQSALNHNFKPLENLEVLSVAPQPEAMKAVEMQLCLDKGNEALCTMQDHCSDDAILGHEEGSTMLNLEDSSKFAGDIEEDQEEVHVSGSSTGSMLALSLNFGPLEDLEVLSVAPQPEAMKAVETRQCLDKGNDAVLEHEEDPVMLDLKDDSNLSEDMEEGQEDEEVRDSRPATGSIGQLNVDASKGAENEPAFHDAILGHEEDPAMLNLEDNSNFSEDMEGGQKDEQVRESGSSVVSIGELEVDASKGIHDAVLEREEDPMMLNLEDNSNFSEDIERGQEDEEVRESGSSVVSIGELDESEVDASKGIHDAVLEREDDPMMLNLEDNSNFSEDMGEGREEDEEVQDSGSSVESIGELEVDASKGTGHEHIIISHDAVLECEEGPVMLNSESSKFSEEMEEDQEEEAHFSGSSIGSIGELEADPPKGNEHEPTPFAEFIDSPLPIEPISVETENLYFEGENQSLEVDLFSQEPSPGNEISANEHQRQLCNDAEQDDSWSFWSLSRQTATLQSQPISIDEENQGSEGEHTKKEGKPSEDSTSLWSFWSVMEGPEPVSPSSSPDSQSLSQVELQSPNQSPRTRKLFSDEDILEEDCFTPVKRQSPARLSPLSSAAKSLSKSAKRANQRTPLQALSCNPNKENQTPKVLKLHNSSMVKKGVMQRTPLRALSMESPQKSVSKNSMSGGATLSAVSNKENQTPKVTRQEWKSARISSPEPSNLFMLKREADAEKLPFRSLFLDSSEESILQEQKSAMCSSPERMPLQTLFVDSPQKSLDFITSQNSENKKKGFVDQAKRWTMVVDITCLLNENSRRALQLLEGVKGTQLVVPEAVVKELDSMKSSDSFSASEWIEECLIRTKWWIQVHSSSDSALDLALCLKRMQKDGRLVLLSDDSSTKIKAMEEGLICESAVEFRKSLVNPFSGRFLWAGSSARGRTWSCFDDVILRRNFYPDYMMKGVENAKGLKLALLQN